MKIKEAFKKFQLNLIGDIVFAVLHQMDIRIKKKLINFDISKRPAIYAVWHGYQWGIGLFDRKDRKNIFVLWKQNKYHTGCYLCSIIKH